jgi:hypothetical protein
VATSEPVVLHHGRQVGGSSRHEVRPSASTAVRWAAWEHTRCALARFSSSRVREGSTSGGVTSPIIDSAGPASTSFSATE